MSFHYGDKNGFCLHWQQRGHKGDTEVFLTIHSHVPTTWMDLEGIMLCEIRQRDNNKYHGVTLKSGI